MVPVSRGESFEAALYLSDLLVDALESDEKRRAVPMRCLHEQHTRLLRQDGPGPSARKQTHSHEAATDGQVARLADEILSLNLLQAKELSDLLRSRLGIEGSVGMGAGAVTPAALAAMQQAMAAAAAAETKQEKTEFDVVLEKFDPSKKIQVIKEVRSALGLGLKEAKELVEAAPKVIKSSLPKNDAEALVERLKQFGATLAIQ
ncbi:hypothetical protein F1559_004234 [Cyanidiococcus yangmingshanensis]|uniref:50S ribosomal protein L12, chloroplastic n=1 Tax=Cyanidiococcus yangmingshanensis TaxID=2690220 RepID=A0A7J7IN65_9RHOD|nr:hypothetical protein F1559_004234 [Cyanidiococcus yangmingshanensis]